MIEINLLPAEYRTVQATPWPRLLALAAGTALALVGGMFLARYHWYALPEARNHLAFLNQQITQKQGVVDELAQIEKQLADLAARKTAITNLQKARILWARLLDRFRRIINPLTPFAVQSFAVEDQGGRAQDGRRFVLRFGALAGGSNMQDITARITQFVQQVNTGFQISAAPSPTAVAGAAPVPPAPGMLPAGYHRDLKLKFTALDFPDYSPQDFPWPEQLAKENLPRPAKAVSLSIAIPFFMQPIPDTP